MNVLLVSAAYPPHDSGEAAYAHRMAEWLKERGHEVRVASNAETPGGLVVKRWDWQGGRDLVSRLASAPPEAVVLHYTDWIYGHPMVRWLPTLLGHLKPRPKLLTLFHNHVNGKFEGNTGWWGRERDRIKHGTLLHQSDRIVVLADWHKRLLTRLEPGCAERCETVPVFSFLEPRGKPRAWCRKDLGLDPKAFWISFYGYLYGDKDLRTLFRALTLLRGRGEDARLLLVGGAPNGQEHFDRIYRQAAEEEGILDSLVFLGKHSSSEKAPSLALSASDVCALPFLGGASTRRSSLAAALGHGLPVVSPFGPETSEILVDKEGLLLHRPGDAQDLTRVLWNLARDPQSRQRHGDAARELHDEIFSFQGAMERLESLIGQGGGQTFH